VNERHGKYTNQSVNGLRQYPKGVKRENKQVLRPLNDPKQQYNQTTGYEGRPKGTVEMGMVFHSGRFFKRRA
jgi:hypothetical protein